MGRKEAPGTLPHRAGLPRPLRLRRAAGAALALALLLASAPPARAERVRVEIRGLDGALEDNVEAVLGILQLDKDAAPGEIRRQHARAPQEIAGALEPFGYYRVETRSDLRQDGGTWMASYEVRLGPPMRVREVEVEVTGEGAGLPAFRDLVRRFPLREGDVLEHPLYERGRNLFSEAALDAGYLDARFLRRELYIDRAGYFADVRLHFDTGPRYYFGPVQFHQSILDTSFLRGYVTFHRGEPLDFDRLLILQNSLSESPYFKTAEVRPLRDEAVDQHVPIDVRLVPQRRMRLDVGAGYGTDTGPQTRASAVWRRLNRKGHRAESELRLSFIEWSAAGTYTIPWPYPRTDRLDFSVGWARFNTETSDSRTWRVGSKYSRVRGRWQETGSLFYQRESFVSGPDSAVVKMLVPESGRSMTRADDRLDPRHGLRIATTIRGASSSVLSDVSFFQLELRAKTVQEFAPRHRLLARADGGYTSVRDFRRLPPTFRYFAGGAHSVRGYAFRSLGPRGVNGEVTGGRYLAVGSLEYEYRLMPKWGVALFYDTGNAMHHIRYKLMNGAGAGLRWVSPIGLIRGDLAKPLNGDRRRLHLHLSIGPEL